MINGKINPEYRGNCSIVLTCLLSEEEGSFKKRYEAYVVFERKNGDMSRERLNEKILEVSNLYKKRVDFIARYDGIDMLKTFVKIDEAKRTLASGGEVDLVELLA
jgi:hypothetical protein